MGAQSVGLVQTEQKSQKQKQLNQIKTKWSQIIEAIEPNQTEILQFEWSLFDNPFSWFILNHYPQMATISIKAKDRIKSNKKKGKKIN